MGYLGTTLHYGRDIGPKLFLQQFSGHLIHIFHRIMQQCGSKDLWCTNIEFCGENASYLARVHNVGFARTAALINVGTVGKIKGIPEHLGFRCVANDWQHGLAVPINIEFFVLHAARLLGKYGQRKLIHYQIST